MAKAGFFGTTTGFLPKLQTLLPLLDWCLTEAICSTYPIQIQDFR